MNDGDLGPALASASWLLVLYRTAQRRDPMSQRTAMLSAKLGRALADVQRLKPTLRGSGR